MKKTIIFATIIFISLMLFLYIIDNERPIGKSIKTSSLERIVVNNSVTIKTDANSPVMLVKKISKKNTKYFLVLQIDTLVRFINYSDTRVIFDNKMSFSRKFDFPNNLSEYPYSIIELKNWELMSLACKTIKEIQINPYKRKLRFNEAFNFKMSVRKILNAI